MNMGHLKPGDRVTWLHEPRGGYGFSRCIDAVVVCVRPTRVQIEVFSERRGLVRRWVTRAHLRPPRTFTSGPAARSPGDGGDT